MKTLAGFFASYRSKVTLGLMSAIFFALLLSNFLVFNFSQRLQFQRLRERLKIIAQTATLSISADTLAAMSPTSEAINSSEYKTVFEQLNRIKEANPFIRYIYTLAKTDKEGVLRFLVDLDPLAEQGKRRWVSAFPGDEYQAARFPEMLAGFNSPSVDDQIMTDEWGRTLSAYAPIKNSAGQVIAILGIDMLAEDIFAMQQQAKRRFLMVFGLGFFIAIIFGFFISERLTIRVRKLVDGTRRIAADDFNYKVDVKGHDEIAELADSFNKMATSLGESKRRLQDYFFRVVQSLVRILEAKDPYTRGHSERVADYARMIASQMGFSQEKCEIVKKAAELHDIGKLAIYEDILNKNGKLTEEEWAIVREHPALGEDVLKPVLIDEDILAMIRSHHERYDGSGYPDRSKGDHINIFAQIVSVADSYDAMTSTRAYRIALSKEAAIAELKKNSGTQFNTQIVNAFLKALGYTPA